MGLFLKTEVFLLLNFFACGEPEKSFNAEPERVCRVKTRKELLGKRVDSYQVGSGKGKYGECRGGGEEILSGCLRCERTYFEVHRRTSYSPCCRVSELATFRKYFLLWEVKYTYFHTRHCVPCHFIPVVCFVTLGRLVGCLHNLEVELCVS